ncbi:MAG: glycosyltransferase family 4 protein [Alphaproteobacteria bacterium]|nr:glycosyltransferase family 4 protein [Alphaproteobacteria bacterium]
MTRVRVCFPFVGDSIGGSHISATLLVRHLDPARYEPLVVVHEEGPLCELLVASALPYAVIPLDDYAGRVPRLAAVAGAMARAMPSLCRFIRSRRIAIVHTNDLRMHLTWAVPARLGGAKFLWHQRVLLSRSPLWRLLAGAADGIACISGTVRDTLPRAARRRALVIANPCDIAAVPDKAMARQTLLRRIGAGPATVVIGYVGNMTAQKRPRVFLDAAARLAPALGSAEFVLIGDDRGGEEAACRALARAHGLSGRVHFVGFQRPIEPWIAGLDLLLAPGVQDGFGRTVVEALLCATPVVASDSGGHRETLALAADLLVAPDDPEALALAARRVLADPATAARCERLRADATHRYAPATHAHRIEAIYAAMLRRGAVASP